eukprot:1761401-Rhodomonas_salina.1
MAKLVGLPEETVARVQKKLVAAWREEARQLSLEAGTDVEEKCEEELEEESQVVPPCDPAPIQQTSASAPTSDSRTETLDQGGHASVQVASGAAVSGASLAPEQPVPENAGPNNRDEMLWKAECHGLLRRLTKHAKAWPFLEP